MVDQEKISGVESENVEGKKNNFSEKLKSLNTTTGEETDKSKLEEIIKQNQEMVKKSELSIEKAQERLAETPTPVSVVKDDDDDDKKNKRDAEEKQKEHVKFHAKDVTSLDNPEDQILKIVELASTKDPYFAIKVAKHIDNNYILDKVHDRLTEDQVREALVKKGLLENVR